MTTLRSILTFAVVTSWLVRPVSADDALRGEAQDALRRAVTYFRANVSTRGGYLWRYSADLSRREGEGRASAQTVWVQPPGTPAVGQAYLAAWRATGDRLYLNAARDCAAALVEGQLRSGGWDHRIEFAPSERRRYAYRVEQPSDGQNNVTTLDDNTTQAAMSLLMHVDQALEFDDALIHEAVKYAIDRLLEAQYQNGAWPQRFSGPPHAEDSPVKRASYPESWPREYPGTDYRGYYTLNDNTLRDMILVMLAAADIYDRADCRRAAERGGGFLLLAQMPEPQPAWAQQYNREMHPAWARRFEPPAITGGESHGAVQALMQLYRCTADRKYVEPIPAALAYLRKSRLEDGRLARFYELRTNRPLYFTRDYRLTYVDDDLPTHYGFKTSDWTAAVAAEYESLVELSADQLRASLEPPPPHVSRRLLAATRATITDLDDEGRWLTTARLQSSEPSASAEPVLDCGIFVRNVRTLTRYLAATRPSGAATDR